ncbi:MAG TPA: ImmA/IrrE family metallo-endopeptidase [Blastocatellia bacterium]|nr:ImmA/IrrE family metallo-endopeptidase [Blastocatellia bacterium]HMV84406.1 ImmA/IrrE family metallo-endopeptidase [Blastocatellia bacterium]HMZ21307.1 ImmA/IrrE family metallo-endopeptidase [Blastocatellia bacterium]
MTGSCGNKECLDRLSYLPAITSKFRHYEQIGLRVRSFIDLGIHDKLDPAKLAETVGLKIVSLDAVSGLSEEAKAILSDSAAGWSGGASSTLPDGSHIIFLNPSQSPGRQAATLMEEICHVLLGHQQSKIGLGENHRNYNDSIEEEAYSVGAAALVPYRSLACNLARGQSIQSIARHFGVTQALIRYRMRILHLTVVSSGIFTT